MLQVGRSRGKEVIIGDHSVVTVVDVDSTSREVKLGFDTRDQVSRVDTPEMMVRAAKIKARAKNAHSKRTTKMEKLPVYVAHSTDGDVLQIKASLSKDKAYYPGSSVAKVDDKTSLTPTHHEFVVFRCGGKAEAAAVRRMGLVMLDWAYMDEVEHDDASTYLLMVRTVVKADEADVRYVDLAVN